MPVNPVMKIHPGIVDSGSDESETGEASPITKSMSQVNYEDIMPGLRGCETQNLSTKISREKDISNRLTYMDNQVVSG